MLMVLGMMMLDSLMVMVMCGCGCFDHTRGIHEVVVGEMGYCLELVIGNVLAERWTAAAVTAYAAAAVEAAAVAVAAAAVQAQAAHWASMVYEGRGCRFAAHGVRQYPRSTVPIRR